MSGGALAGVRVLDLSRFVSGPLCTFFLASMGAEVLAVETPSPSGSRRLPPFALPTGGHTAEAHDGAISIPFLKRGRGKRSVAVDIRRGEGQELVRALAQRCDVLVENARPGALEALGLGYDALSEINPRLVYCAISGFGADEPGRPAMDVVVQALSGMMAKTGFADGPPTRAGTTVADHATATFGALGIVAALRERDRTGRGQLVDVAMLDVMTALVWDEPVDFYAEREIPVRTGNADARGAPINAYRCRDGWVAVTCTADEQWHGFCNVMGRPDLRDRFSNMRDRSVAAREVDDAVEAWTRTRDARDVEAAFLSVGMPAGRVRDPVEARRDPVIVRRGVLESLRHPDAPEDSTSDLLGPRLPIAFSGRVGLTPAEQLGASTDAVLREHAGCDDDRLARLRAAGVIA